MTPEQLNEAKRLAAEPQGNCHYSKALLFPILLAAYEAQQEENDKWQKGYTQLDTDLCKAYGANVSPQDAPALITQLLADRRRVEAICAYLRAQVTALEAERDKAQRYAATCQEARNAAVDAFAEAEADRDRYKAMWEAMRLFVDTHRDINDIAAKFAELEAQR